MLEFFIKLKSGGQEDSDQCRPGELQVEARAGLRAHEGGYARDPDGRSQGGADEAAQEGGEDGLGEEQAPHLCASGAGGAQDADLAGALQDEHVGGVGQAGQGDEQGQKVW